MIDDKFREAIAAMIDACLAENAEEMKTCERALGDSIGEAFDKAVEREKAKALDTDPGSVAD
jgi:hypothetical protein